MHRLSKALTALVAEDVRFVNVAGNVLNGRGEFEKLQTRTHAPQFKDSVRAVTRTDIKFLTAEIAVADVRWGMRGDKDADGTPRRPRNGMIDAGPHARPTGKRGKLEAVVEELLERDR